MRRNPETAHATRAAHANTSRESFLSRRWTVGAWPGSGLAILYIALVTVAIYFWLPPLAYDDPYITYRYARNLSAGSGFVYNPGERVLSTTTPLFTLLLAGLAPFWPDLPQSANLIGAASLALGGLCLWRLGHLWRTPLAGAAGLLLYPTFPLVWMTVGSETPLYLALCIGAFAAYAQAQFQEAAPTNAAPAIGSRHAYWLCACACALAVLTRPDGLLVPALLGTDFLIRRWRLAGRRNRRITDAKITSPQTHQHWPWSAALVFILLLAPWIIFAWEYFGSPIPATLLVKQHQGAMASSQKFAPGFLATLRWYVQRYDLWLEAGLALVGLLFVFWRARRWASFFAWPALYFIAYTILGVSRYFWYYTPLVPGFLALVGLGLDALAGSDPRTYLLAPSDPAKTAGFKGGGRRLQNSQGEVCAGGPHSSRAGGLRKIFAWGALVLLAIAQFVSLWQVRGQKDPRYDVYRAAGEWLAQNTPIGSTAATLEVGVIGYFSQRPMIDFAGLLQPEVARQLGPQTTYADAASWAIGHYRPQYLVLQRGLFPHVEQNDIPENCRLVITYPGQAGKPPGTIDIYECLQQQ